MASIEPVRVSFTDTHILWVWGVAGTGVASGDTCVPAKLSGHKEMTFSAIGGTWGSGSVALHGSIIDGGATGHVALTNAARDVIAMTANGLTEVLQNCAFVKPVLTGSGASGLFFYLYSRL